MAAPLRWGVALGSNAKGPTRAPKCSMQPLVGVWKLQSVILQKEVVATQVFGLDGTDGNALLLCSAGMVAHQLLPVID